MRLRPNMGLLRQTESADPSFHPDLDRYLRDRALRAATLHADRSKTSDDPRGTKLTGTPYLTAAEGWPACEQCGRPLHHLFQINFEEIGYPALEGVALLSFFYCIGCSPEDHTMPGSKVLLRSDLSAEPHPFSLPPLPPQEEQPLPVILLRNQPMALTARLGPDLPSPLDEGVWNALESLEVLPGTPVPPPERAMRELKLRILKDGAEQELHLHLAPGAHFDPEAWSQHYSILDWEVRTVPPRPDYHEQYYEYLQRLYKVDDLARSKVGGWILGAQDPRFTHCSCGEPLVHLVTIMTRGEARFVVGDSGGLYFAACPKCEEKPLVWWNDYY